MNRKEFANIRQHLGVTQNQFAQILGVSAKAIQSFEQGWRNVPLHVERQALLMLARKNGDTKKTKPCWSIRHCPADQRKDCPAWQFHAGDLCWFINGTICEGRPQLTWTRKIQICRKCVVYRSIMPRLI